MATLSSKLSRACLPGDYILTLASYTDFALSALRNAVDGVTFGAVDVAVSKIITEGFGQPELIAKA